MGFSVKGFDAQSTGLFYVRVDKGSSYALAVLPTIEKNKTLAMSFVATA